jgi:hypothetical protein
MGSTACGDEAAKQTFLGVPVSAYMLHAPERSTRLTVCAVVGVTSNALVARTEAAAMR